MQSMDPIRYEMFLHRLWAVGEEGRMTLQRVTASPIVAQGGECMSSFYDVSGTMVLACSGHLRFAHATSDAIKTLISWFKESPGFFDGDQFFFNDPYVAGAHTYDMMVIKPIFHAGELVAWVATSTHTADTGGMVRGAASEIYHEGIRIMGLKVVEHGQFREDVFKTLTEQCRDPQYVGLDLKAMIAGNNVCARRYLELIDKFGLEFVQAAGAKIISDAEEAARAKLLSLADGRWVGRTYLTCLDAKQRKAMPLQIVCTLTKYQDQLTLDFTGTSPQTTSDVNSTFPSTRALIGVAITNTLFWDVPWSDGKFAPLRLVVPEGSVLNCRFPAACAAAPVVGGILVATVCEAASKMLFAAGRYDDVTATWYATWYEGGPGYIPAGHNREGVRTAMGIYDIHGSGLGATPSRDGVDTGGHMNIPSAGISDIERTEMQYPMLYFSRNHNPEGSGFGKYRGGLGTYRIFIVYGSQDFSVDFKPYGWIPQGAYGLFGGHPTGPGGIRAIFHTEPDLPKRLEAGHYPTRLEEIDDSRWGTVFLPEGAPGRVSLPEFTLLSDYVQSGGGYGDPLDRDPERVGRDVRIGVCSKETARQVYGVVLIPESFAVDITETRKQRQAIRNTRFEEGRAEKIAVQSDGGNADWQHDIKIHEVLEVARNGSEERIRCMRCGFLFGSPGENYKKYCLKRVVELQEICPKRPASDEPYLGRYHEYICPGCVTLLQVDVYCPELGGEEDLWDIQIARLPTLSSL
jgi:N-methylhydantoinase B